VRPNGPRRVRSLLQRRVWAGLDRAEELPLAVGRRDHTRLDEGRRKVRKRRVDRRHRVDWWPLHVRPVCGIRGLVSSGGCLSRPLQWGIRWRHLYGLRRVRLQRDALPERRPLRRRYMYLRVLRYNQLRRLSWVWPRYRPGRWSLTQPGARCCACLCSNLDDSEPGCLRLQYYLLHPGFGVCERHLRRGFNRRSRRITSWPVGFLFLRWRFVNDRG
jgi:hypothetical protein